MAPHRIPQRASVKDARALSKLAWVRDDTLSCGSYEARVLPDGRVLFYLGEGLPGTIWPSREVAAEHHRKGQEAVARGPIDLSRTLLPPVDEFLRDADVLAKRLGAQLGIPGDTLDGSEASLDAVDERVWRMPRAKRMTADLMTPLLAYIGQVMARATDGRWTKAPKTHKVSVPVYHPSEKAAWDAKYPARLAARDRAIADAKARGASDHEATMAGNLVWGQFITAQPKPIRFDEQEEPISGHENEPMVLARGGGILQPFAIIMREFEMGGRGSLRGAVGGSLARHRPGRASNSAA